MSDNLPQHKPLQTLESRTTWESPFYRIREDTVQVRSGGQETYYVLEKRTAVWVVPVTPQNEIVLIYQYRHAVESWLWEVPAGGVETGHTPLQTAHKELKEEIGGTSDDMQLLLNPALKSGLSSQYGFFFLARDVTPGTPEREALEFMVQRTFPVAEALQMARNGDIQDANSVLALLLAEPHLT